MIIGVIGKGQGASEELCALAREVGHLLATFRPRVFVAQGGLGGTMAAVAEAARAEGAFVISIIPHGRPAQVHEHADLVLHTGLAEGFRNVLLATLLDAVVMLPGAEGTLTEAAVCRDRAIPMVWTGDHSHFLTESLAFGAGSTNPVMALNHLRSLTSQVP